MYHRLMLASKSVIGLPRWESEFPPLKLSNFNPMDVFFSSFFFIFSFSSWLSRFIPLAYSSSLSLKKSPLGQHFIFFRLASSIFLVSDDNTHTQKAIFGSRRWSLRRRGTTMHPHPSHISISWIWNRLTLKKYIYTIMIRMIKKKK